MLPDLAIAQRLAIVQCVIEYAMVYPRRPVGVRHWDFSSVTEERPDGFRVQFTEAAPANAKIDWQLIR